MKERNKMKTKIFLPIALIGLCMLLFNAGSVKAQDSKDWSLNATLIEACSCTMFCQCYFNTTPAGHKSGSHSGKEEHYCRFNFGGKVNSGYYGNVKLDGAKFWIAGDLGDDFSDGECEWLEVTFDPSVTKEQRDALAAILPNVYPVKWKSFTVADDKKIDWTATKDRSEAKLDGGKAGEVILNRFPGNTDEPIVIKNLKYWGVPRNDGFVLMPTEVEAYRVGDHRFEFRGSNGFMITYDINSNDVKK